MTLKKVALKRNSFHQLVSKQTVTSQLVLSNDIVNNNDNKCTVVGHPRDSPSQCYIKCRVSELRGVVETKFLGCTLRHHFLKSKNKEPPKFLSSSGMRGGKFKSVNNFSAPEHASSKKMALFKFQGYGGA